MHRLRELAPHTDTGVAKTRTRGSRNLGIKFLPNPVGVVLLNVLLFFDNELVYGPNKGSKKNSAYKPSDNPIVIIKCFPAGQ